MEETSKELTMKEFFFFTEQCLIMFAMQIICESICCEINCCHNSFLSGLIRSAFS